MSVRNLRTGGARRASTLCMAALVSLCGGIAGEGYAQSRVYYNAQDVFLSGSNVAWVNFAGDLGPGNLDTVRFRTMFDSIHVHGGNALRWWLHTNGTQTPDFDGSGRVSGPGSKAALYLTKILDMAWQRKIGLVLSLWSFDMQRKSIGSLYTARNAMMLNDTSYARSYIDNALIPLARAIKGHPAIISWEVFNEAEGMSNEYGWSDIYHVPMSNIQRFVNLVAGAIHRVDSTAKVTTGAWDLTAETDVNPLPKPVNARSAIAQMSAAEIQRIEGAFEARYHIKESAEQILAHYALPNYNFYRDDRLVAAGGDPLGTLDIYTSHYYNNGQSTSLCPFLHPSATYGLTKPLVIAEFWPEDVVGVPYADLYRILYDAGYAGAMSWGWYSGGTGHDQTVLQGNTLALLQDLYSRYPEQIEISPVSGTIYAFSAQPVVVDRGESSIIDWKTALGTTATLNGISVAVRGTMIVTPDTATLYTLLATGSTSHTAQVTVNVYPSGKIISFTSSAATIGTGDHAQLRWKVTNGSLVTLNDSVVNRSDSMVVRPTATRKFTLVGAGMIRDTSTFTITVVPGDRFNRALGRPVSVGGSSTNPLYANPQNAVDGDTATQWVSATGTSHIQSITCDLGQNTLISRVLVRWGSRYPTTYHLSLRVEGGIWSTARSLTNGAGGTETIDSLNQVGRYVLLWLGTAGDTGFAIREMEVYGIQDPSSVDGAGEDVPGQYALLQNYPNPFNPNTTIAYCLPAVQAGDVRLRSAWVTLAMYDMLGREVAVLVNEEKGPGTHTLIWNAANRSSGVYLCRLQVFAAGGQVPSYVQTRKLVVLK